MGRMRHHTIVVTGWDAKAMEQIHHKAIRICGMLVSPLVDSHMNGYVSFFVAPDGSKEGWASSNEGDDNRELLKVMLDATMADWVEVQFADEAGDNRILSSSGSVRSHVPDNITEQSGRRQVSPGGLSDGKDDSGVSS